MNLDDLIKKLEKAELPEIELPSHKRQLKTALINWKYQAKKGGVFSVFPVLFKKRLIPLAATVAVIILVLISANFLSPAYTLAKVRNIAMQNPQLKNLIDKGAEIKDIVVTNNSKAYVLITPQNNENGGNIGGEATKEEIKGALAEIEIKEERVSKIEEIAPQVIPLTLEEEKRVKEIVTKEEASVNQEESQATQTQIEKGGFEKDKNIEFEKIESLPTYDLKLEKQNGNVKIIPQKDENDDIRVVYKIDGETREGKINLSQEKLEKIEKIERIEKAMKEGE